MPRKIYLQLGRICVSCTVNWVAKEGLEFKKMKIILQAKNFNVPGSQGRWPKKSAEILLQLLKNAESNAELKVCSNYCFH